MRKLITNVAALVLLGAPLLSSASDTLSRIRDRNAIVIAHRESSVPFSYLGEKGRPIGYAMDICMKVVDVLKSALKLPQLEVKYLPVTQANHMQAVADGKADMECGSTTNTRERRKTVDFSIAYFVASTRMMVRSDSGIKNWADLRDRKIVTTRGTTTAKSLIDKNVVRSLSITLLEGKDHAEGFSMVESRKADAFAMDDVLLYRLKASARNPADFQVVGDSLSTEPYAIIVRKGDAKFKGIVDREVVRVMNDGDIYALYDKWFAQPIPPIGINMNTTVVRR